MLAAVALVALLLASRGWWSEMQRRRASYLARAEEYSAAVRCYDQALAFPRGDPSDPLYQIRMPELLHFQRLEAKYRLAAARPWMPVEPDPPEPK
jgi:hypothetical protein